MSPISEGQLILELQRRQVVPTPRSPDSYNDPTIWFLHLCGSSALCLTATCVQTVNPANYARVSLCRSYRLTFLRQVVHRKFLLRQTVPSARHMSNWRARRTSRDMATSSLTVRENLGCWTPATTARHQLTGVPANSQAIGPCQSSLTKWSSIIPQQRRNSNACLLIRLWPYWLLLQLWVRVNTCIYLQV